MSQRHSYASGSQREPPRTPDNRPRGGASHSSTRGTPSSRLPVRDESRESKSRRQDHEGSRVYTSRDSDFHYSNQSRGTRSRSRTPPAGQWNRSQASQEWPEPGRNTQKFQDKWHSPSWIEQRWEDTKSEQNFWSWNTQKPTSDSPRTDKSTPTRYHQDSILDMATCYEFRRDLNPTWVSDETHLDAGGSQVPGRKDPIPPLYRFIANSEWARSKGIVGKDIRSIRLIDLTYKKLDNWYIRNLSAGRAVNVEFARNVRESMIVQAVLQEFRTIRLQLGYSSS